MFLFVYLDWGHEGGEFIWQLESSFFARYDDSSALLVNIFVILALIGQVLLIIATIKSKPSRQVTIYGIAFLSVIVILVFIMGLVVSNAKIILSTLPFLTLASIFIAKTHNMKTKTNQPD